MSKPTRPRQHRVYQPGKRHMELMPSVSRSSGLEKGGDALRDYKVQEEYRAFIQGKVDAYWEEFPYGKPSVNEKQRDEVQGNILILFRKLREGILSTKRSDSFALEAYEVSLHLSVVFNSPAQTTSIISHLVPDLYQRAPELPPTVSWAALISAFHFLVAAYPSQSRCSEHLALLPSSFLPKDAPPHKWLSDVMRALRSRNFARFESLTKDDKIKATFPIDEFNALPENMPSGLKPTKDKTRQSPGSLPLIALLTLVDSLRQRVRETTWSVIRSAYRELHCRAVDASGQPLVPSPTGDWLHRTLGLRSTITKVLNDDPEGTEEEVDSAVSKWLEEKSSQGEVRVKEGSEGCWIVCKIRPA